MRVDVALVGGGLANALVALRLAALRPELELVVLEQGERVGGSHTWSFHESDLERGQLSWLEPLVAARWPAYHVRFPDLERRVALGYASITSERLRQVLSRTLGSRVVLRATATSIGPTAVTLAGGEVIEAACVIDGRGAVEPLPLRLGYQKFVGLELRAARGHGQSRPVVMDARVAQDAGFRFFYTLPLSGDLLLVEETRYSEDASLDQDGARAAILEYAARLGLERPEVVREEQGVLPIPLGGDLEGYWRGVSVARSGLRGALFHPTTGYSLPEAARLADALAALVPLTSGAALEAARGRSIALWRRGGFFRFLNRMLLRAAPAPARYRVLERFYGLSDALVARFYAGRPSLADRARLLVGRPPVPVVRALRCLREEAG